MTEEIQYDAIVVGGGPSGAITGLMLARAGWRVAILEKMQFPRPKVCGDYVSGATLGKLNDLRVTPAIAKFAGPEVRRVGVFQQDVTVTAPMPQNMEIPWGRAVRRQHLDDMLLTLAGRAGADVWQPCKSTLLNQDVAGWTCNFLIGVKQQTVRANILVIASGSSNTPWGEGTEMASRKGSDLLAFKAYFSNANLPKDLMVLLAFPGGYGGLVHVAGDIVSLSCCIRRDTLQNQRRMIPRAAQAVFHHICNSCGGAREVLKDTIVEGPWFAAGPLKTGIRSPYQNRILFVGNAAGEAHPIIAEGISMGIQSGWLVAKCLTAYEPAAAARQLDEIGKRYRKMWLKCFRQRIYLAALYAAIASRSATSAAVRPFIEWQPQLLTLGARLSGKIA